MKIKLEEYNQKYHQGGKFIDKFQEGIKILPFDSRNASAFGKRCGLQGTTGEFFRLWIDDGTTPIEDFENSAVIPVIGYLKDIKMMPDFQIPQFIRMMKDIMLVNGHLNITDSSFLKYIPLMPNDERIQSKERNMYKDGQRKLANFLYSMLSDDMQSAPESGSKDLFSKIIQESLTPFGGNDNEKKQRDYYIIPYIRQSFEKDLKWLLSLDESVKVKYIHLLLHFYACYAVTQATVRLKNKCDDFDSAPAPFYFILNSEKASVNHDAVIRGWSSQIPKMTLDRLYGKLQALDIMNSTLGSNIGFYSDVIKKLEETPFEENRDACYNLLNSYQQDKRNALSGRSSEKHILDAFGEIDVNISSYEEFAHKLERLCMGLQSPSYISRMRKKVIDLLSVRFLQNRKRSGYVLVLDNEMLIFLIALFSKGKKTKLEDLYKLFNSYGIYFNRGSRLAIEEYLIKLNLLDRKSDSGEAQYVTVIL